MRSLITAALVLSFASSASGINEQWFKFGDTTRAAVTGVKQGEWVSSTPDSNSDDTQVLSIGCENFEVFINQDPTGADTDATAMTYQIQYCGTPQTTLTTEALQDAGCQNYSSVGLKTANADIHGVGGLFFKVQVGGTFAGSPSIIVSCVGSSGSR